MIEEGIVAAAVAMLEPAGPAMRATWSYISTDPWAVTLRLHTPRGIVSWRFDRELLAAGLVMPAGEGDVQVEPVPGGAMLLELNSPTGHARFRLETDKAAQFLAASYRHVPLGAEQVDWDVEKDLLHLEEEGS